MLNALKDLYLRNSGESLINLQSLPPEFKIEQAQMNLPIKVNITDNDVNDQHANIEYSLKTWNRQTTSTVWDWTDGDWFKAWCNIQALVKNSAYLKWASPPNQNGDFVSYMDSLKFGFFEAPRSRTIYSLNLENSRSSGFEGIPYVNTSFQMPIKLTIERVNDFETIDPYSKVYLIFKNRLMVWALKL